MAINLLEGEKIIVMRKRHWFALLAETAPLLLLALGALSAPAALPVFASDFFGQYESEIMLGAGLMIQLVVSVFFLLFVDYHLDFWIVTDQRLIFAELNGLFSQRVSSIDLVKIQDISVSISGILPTFLHFGDLEIQTAGASGPFVFKQISSPEEMKNKIMELKKQSQAAG